jgi:hypothetical protein
VQAFASDHPGHVDLRWRTIYGAKAYNIERAEDGPELIWKFMTTTTKREASVNTMVSGKKYWHRIAAIGAAGQSPWSDPVPLIAP